MKKFGLTSNKHSENLLQFLRNIKEKYDVKFEI